MKLILKLLFLGISLFALMAKAQSIETEFLYKISLDIDKPFDTGKSAYGTKIAYPIIGGKFEGPKIKGTVKPVGEDWLTKVDDSTNKLDVRIILETEEGDLIACSYNGIVHNSADGKTYWRMTPTFQTSSKKYDWLNYMMAVGKGSFVDGKVTYEVFVVK